MISCALGKQKCTPCEGGISPLGGENLRNFFLQLGGNWKNSAEKKIEKEYSFPDFAQALRFVNRVGAIAEEEGHHPEIDFGWGRVRIVLWTHSVGGLTENDFILAAKCDEAFQVGS